MYSNQTRLKIREDTELKNCPLFCPKCKQETLLQVRNYKCQLSENQT
ncbi:cysteine-rich KTR domain-containing protein [Anaeromassilibacillus sp. Marseille-P3371]